MSAFTDQLCAALALAVLDLPKPRPVVAYRAARRILAKYRGVADEVAASVGGSRG